MTDAQRKALNDLAASYRKAQKFAEEKAVQRAIKVLSDVSKPKGVT